MHFGFPLGLSDEDLWDIDLLDADLGLLDTDISSKHFVCLQGVWKTTSRHVFKKWFQDVFNTFFEDVFKTFSA